MTPHLTPESGLHLLVPIPGRWSRIVQFVNNPSLPVTDSELTMSAPSKMDKGAPEVGESSSSSEEQIPVPPPVTFNTPVPLYKVGVIQRSSGHRGVHPYHDIAIHSVP